MPGPFVCTLPRSLPQGAENETHYTQLLGSTGAVCGEVPLPPAAAHCIFLSSSPQQSLQQRERRPSDVGDLLRVTQLGETGQGSTPRSVWPPNSPLSISHCLRSHIGVRNESLRVKHLERQEGTGRRRGLTEERGTKAMATLRPAVAIAMAPPQVAHIFWTWEAPSALQAW